MAPATKNRNKKGPQPFKRDLRQEKRKQQQESLEALDKAVNDFVSGGVPFFSSLSVDHKHFHSVQRSKTTKDDQRRIELTPILRTLNLPK